MGIKSDSDAPGSAFSRDVLRVEISGPNEQHLTIIDVPGMFENETPGLTTKADIELVKDMVRSYIRETRTIILAVVPCTGDIANQKILTYAKTVDPDGRRTMGVLTKPDLAIERATQDEVAKLVRGGRGDLKLGYCLVKNRGADDMGSSSEQRDRQEKDFFAGEPWKKLPAERLGVPSLKKRLQALLMDTTRSEFPKVRAELTEKLNRMQEDLKGMGESRATPDQQRAYLCEVATKFTEVKNQALDAYYTRNKILADNPDLKLITKIREISENFSRVLYQKGHMRAFDDSGASDQSDAWDGKDEEDSLAYEYDHDEDGACTERDSLYDWQAKCKIPDLGADDLCDILSEPYRCPLPSEDGILKHIQAEYMTSRGIELGTFSGEMLPITFKEQAKKWAPMARAHVSNAILVVHHFIYKVLERCCPDPAVRDELWAVLLDELREKYKRAVTHTEFLLDVEFEGTNMTYNPSFHGRRDRSRLARMQPLREESNDEADDILEKFACLKETMKSILGLKDPVKLTRQEIHDVLLAYYDIARDRFVDVLNLQVIHHYLLLAKDSPLNMISSVAVLKMSPGQLDSIAGEDTLSRERRRQLEADIDVIHKALKILRS